MGCEHEYHRYLTTMPIGPNLMLAPEAHIPAGFSVCLKCRRVEMVFPGDKVPTIFENGVKWSSEH
jgi:hypothetical protein